MAHIVFPYSPLRTSKSKPSNLKTATPEELKLLRAQVSEVLSTLVLQRGSSEYLISYTEKNLTMFNKQKP